MSKQIILACDIDDVLSCTAAGFILFSNQQWGTGLTADDFSEDWATMWGVDYAEAERRAQVFCQSDIVLDFLPHSDARKILQQISSPDNRYAVTSRRKVLESHTVAWLANHYPETFAGLHFSGAFDDGEEQAIYRTKGQILQELGATHVIDDQLKHCLAAADLGMDVVLFGDYSWNKIEELPDNITRCKDWKEVGEYFNVSC